MLISIKEINGKMIIAPMGTSFFLAAFWANFMHSYHNSIVFTPKIKKCTQEEADVAAIFLKKMKFPSEQ